jgi:hypothetical protein
MRTPIGRRAMTTRTSEVVEAHRGTKSDAAAPQLQLFCMRIAAPHGEPQPASR